jgi:Uma2 family endonuclease
MRKRREAVVDEAPPEVGLPEGASTLPAEAEFGLQVDRVGPIRAEEFESWEQSDDNPLELIAGWVLPMSPQSHPTGSSLIQLIVVLEPVVRAKGWTMSLDDRHRLPRPPRTVLYPDLGIYRTPELTLVPGTQTIARVPDLIVELLGRETARRDQAPHGAKFLTYQMCGVQEYYYGWPDGREAAGFHLRDGRYVAAPRDADGFFDSPFLAAALRLVPAALRQTAP